MQAKKALNTALRLTRVNKLLIGAIGISLLITAVGWFSFKAGVNSEIAAGAKIISDYQAKQRQMVEKLEQAKRERKIVYRDKIKIISEVVDNCADTTVSPTILQQFRQSDTP